MQNTNLIEMLSSTVNALLDFEKQCGKLYLKLEKAAETPELGKALHPEQTSIHDHISRLKIIKKLISNKSSSFSPALSINPVKLKKAKSTLQDLLIAHTALKLQAFKIVDYELILLLSEQLQISHASALITQSITENKATTEWITRTLKHLSA